MATHNHIYPHKRYYWYANSPVADWLGDFSDWLAKSGYCEGVIRRHVAALRFSLEPHAPVPRERCFSQADLQEVIVCPQRPREFRHTRSAFERFLRSCNQWIDPPPTEGHADLLDAFRQHLVEMRGLALSSVVNTRDSPAFFWRRGCRQADSWPIYQPWMSNASSPHGRSGWIAEVFR